MDHVCKAGNRIASVPPTRAHARARMLAHTHADARTHAHMRALLGIFQGHLSLDKVFPGAAGYGPSTWWVTSSAYTFWGRRKRWGMRLVRILVSRFLPAGTEEQAK